MSNIDMRKYGFEEGKSFEGLMPKVQELLSDYTTGKTDEVVSVFDPTANGQDSMMVVSPQLIAEDESDGE